LPKSQTWEKPRLDDLLLVEVPPDMDAEHEHKKNTPSGESSDPTSDVGTVKKDTDHEGPEDLSRPVDETVQ
jgi:hypothetical protein